ncbi:MAG: BlaI/MecI/CopY family transcriptional regulator [Pirellulales bacterium]|nr:BlaI/MecI/CopY family transcriptional regulator [Pirellulales bacterium]
MAKPSPLDLGKRERQIVEAVYLLGEGSVAQVRKQLSDPPSYSAVRAMLGVLVRKGVLRSRREGNRYLYRPAVSKEKARRSVLGNLLATFFAGRPSDAMAALLEVSADKLTAEELDRMARLVEQAKREGR